MHLFVSSIILLSLVFGTSFSQTILYEEHFTGGVTAIDWEPGWTDSVGGGDSMQVDFMADNPSEDGIVGFVENVLSGGMVGTAVGGTLEMADYMVQGWIYVTPDFGATAMAQYKGIVSRFSDDVGHTYYQFVADFNTLASGGMKLRLRKYDGASSVVIHDFFESEIPGGIPAESGWHHMGLLMEGGELSCYWDFELLPGCPYTDETGSPALTTGKFGVYVFSFAGDDAVFCDDIFVTDEYYDPHTSSPVFLEKPEALALQSAFPNPSTLLTIIPVTVSRACEMELSIHDLSGKLVTCIAKEQLTPGVHHFSWDGTTSFGSPAGSGIYLAHATALNRTAVSRITLIR